MKRKYTNVGRNVGQYKTGRYAKKPQPPKPAPTPKQVIADIETAVAWDWVLGESK